MARGDGTVGSLSAEPARCLIAIKEQMSQMAFRVYADRAGIDATVVTTKEEIQQAVEKSDERTPLIILLGEPSMVPEGLSRRAFLIDSSCRETPASGTHAVLMASCTQIGFEETMRKGIEHFKSGRVAMLPGP
mmetsp:Transcript_23330/g.43882  ORF Transcript_23330/g.43882 Transcript_23330/m.43882 type:complete len:133 (+) Transcript_23330:48-446(+)